MERYSEYKDSGVQWLGEIPSHWEVRRLGSYFLERKEKVSDEDFAPLSVTKQGIFPQLENVAKTNDGDNRKLVRIGDFVINSRSDRKGSSGISELDGSVSLINIVLQPRNSLFGPFCNYLLKSYGFIEENYRNGRGIVADLWTTRYDEMKMIKVAMPSLEEQKSISRYLDAATSELDKAIAMQQKMIDLLNERKQIIIQNAVTKGLDKNVEMKDSGVEWIGMIPKHWEIEPIKLYVHKIGDGLHGTPIYNQSGSHYFINGNNLGSECIIFTEKTNLVSSSEAKKYFIELNNNSLLISLNGTIGSTSFYNDEPVVLSKSVGYINFKETIDKVFVRYLFATNKYKNIFMLSLAGTTIANLSLETLRHLKLIIPPKDEQKNIAEYLDKEMQRFDSAITNCQRQITLLQERKQIIINEVVTGKVKVS